jgi:hypothetical protein
MEIHIFNVSPVYSGVVQKFKAEFPGLLSKDVMTDAQEVFKYTGILEIDIIEPR